MSRNTLQKEGGEHHGSGAGGAGTKKAAVRTGVVVLGRLCVQSATAATKCVQSAIADKPCCLNGSRIIAGPLAIATCAHAQFNNNTRLSHAHTAQGVTAGTGRKK